MDYVRNRPSCRIGSTIISLLCRPDSDRDSPASPLSSAEATSDDINLNFSSLDPMKTRRIGSLQALPPVSTLSSSALSFVDAKLGSDQDLAGAPITVSELESQCLQLDQAVVDLNRSLESTIAAHATFSDRIHNCFGDTIARLIDLRSSVTPMCSTSDGGGLGEELPELAKEVARLEKVRVYAGELLGSQLLLHSIN